MSVLPGNTNPQATQEEPIYTKVGVVAAIAVIRAAFPCYSLRQVKDAVDGQLIEEGKDGRYVEARKLGAYLQFCIMEASAVEIGTSLDCVVMQIWNLSQEDAAEAIEQGQVKVGSREMRDASYSDFDSPFDCVTYGTKSQLIEPV